MTTCDRLRDNLKAYHDGELGLPRRLAVRWHVARCERCRKEIALMEEMSKELRAAESGGLSETLRARILANAPQAVADGPSTPLPATPEWRKRRRRQTIVFARPRSCSAGLSSSR